MIDWLHGLPLVLGAGVIVLCFLVPSLIGSAFLQPFFGRLLQGEKDPNALVGMLLNSFTLYYGVLLALLSIAVFDDYTEARDAIGREASSIIALYRDVGAYPEPVRTELMDLLRQYVDEESGPGWREQRRGGVSRRGMLLVDEIGHRLFNFRPDRETGADLLHHETLRRFDEFVEHRRIRIQAGETRVPPVIWYVVLTGAALNVFVLWLFDLKRKTHFVLSGVLMIFVGLVVYMVAVLDQPFRGIHGLDPNELVHARQQMNPR